MAVTKETAPFTFSGNWNITDYGEGRYYARLLSSGTLVPKKDFSADIFLVGAGGGGGTSGKNTYGTAGGGGGSGGETITLFTQQLLHNENINVVIGNADTQFKDSKAKRGRGGSSGRGLNYSSGSYTVLGGQGGKGYVSASDGGSSTIAYPYATDGGYGVSAFNDNNPPFSTMMYAGGGGGGVSYHYPNQTYGSGGRGHGGGGHGSGQWTSPSGGQTNTGGGGGGIGFFIEDSYPGLSTSQPGGSGIVMLRGYYGSFPSDPGDIIMPGAIFSDSTFPISWGASVDADNDLAGYKLERSLDDGNTWTQIYQGAAAHTTDIVPFGTASVMYRVKAYDSGGLESGYKTGATQVVINNNKPVITTPLADLGTQTGAFSFDFSVDDSDPADVISVTVKSGTNEILNIANAVRGQTYTASISAELFVQAHGGVNEIVITATDGKAVVTEKILWTRIVMKVDVIAGEFGGARAVMPTMILISPLIESPVDAILTVLVCNNSFDTSPTWEDASDEARAGSVYLFTNQAKTANDWGIKIRVTLERDALPGTLKLLRLAASVK